MTWCAVLHYVTPVAMSLRQTIPYTEYVLWTEFESVLLLTQVRFNLLQYILPEVKDLYNWLEMDFHPLKLSGRVTKVGGLSW